MESHKLSFDFAFIRYDVDGIGWSLDAVDNIPLTHKFSLKAFGYIYVGRFHSWNYCLVSWCKVSLFFILGRSPK